MVVTAFKVSTNERPLLFLNFGRALPSVGPTHSVAFDTTTKAFDDEIDAEMRTGKFRYLGGATLVNAGDEEYFQSPGWMLTFTYRGKPKMVVSYRKRNWILDPFLGSPKFR